MKYQWVIGGEAGFGIMTTGLTFSKIASRSGYQVLDYVEYPSLIRGGHNAYRCIHLRKQLTYWFVSTKQPSSCINMSSPKTPSSYMIRKTLRLMENIKQLMYHLKKFFVKVKDSQ